MSIFDKPRQGRDRRVDAAGRRRRTGMPGMLLAALAAVAGAASAYLLDPERGRSRRARLLDQARARAGHLGRAVEHRSRRARTRAFAISRQVTHRGDGNAELNDAGLSDKLSSLLFADPSIPQGKINLNVEEGVVVLRGEVDDEGQRDELIHRAEATHGVVRVDSLLHLPGEPAPPEPPRRHARVETGGPRGTLP